MRWVWSNPDRLLTWNVYVEHVQLSVHSDQPVRAERHAAVVQLPVRTLLRHRAGHHPDAVLSATDGGQGNWCNHHSTTAIPLFRFDTIERQQRWLRSVKKTVIVLTPPRTTSSAVVPEVDLSLSGDSQLLQRNTEALTNFQFDQMNPI